MVSSAGGGAAGVLISTKLLREQEVDFWGVSDSKNLHFSATPLPIFRVFEFDRRTSLF
jgi:hypothetical protein